MQYQIGYLNTYGNAKTLADEIANMLSHSGTNLVDLSEGEVSPDADAYFLCFEMTQDAIPLEIMDTLEYLERKTILCFATCAILQDSIVDTIEQKLFPFLPDECDYRGTFVCIGRVPSKISRRVWDALQEQPENRKLSQLFRGYRQSIGHPDADDLRSLHEFIADKLHL